MKNIVLTFGKKVVLHILMWILVWLFFTSFFGVASDNKSFINSFSTSLSAITIISSYVFLYHLIPNYLLKKKQKLFLLYSIYAIIFIVCAILIVVVFGFVFFFNLEYQEMPALTKNAGVIVVCVLLMIAIASVIKIVKWNYKALDEKRILENKFLETQLKLKEQELKFLKMQIHPHFLFNTLNTLYGFAIKKSDETPDLILKLSQLLDYILYQINKQSVLLKDELKHVKDYISLEKYRFSDSLKTEVTIQSFDETIEIAPMLILPFVENAFKHGSILDDALLVKLNLEIKDGELNLNISNTYQKKQNKKGGIGLENIKKRLDFYYNNKYDLAITQNDRIFKVQLKIDLKNE